MGIFVTATFVLVTLLCFCIGIYALYVNIHHRVNILAFLFCITICVWLVAAILSMNAPSEEVAYLWRRFAAIGLASIFGFLLHFVLILVMEDKCNKWWIPFVIYTPTAFMVCVLALSQQVGRELYHMTFTEIGWVNMRTKSIWTILFDVYITVYTLCGLFLAFRWRRKAETSQKRKQTNLIISAYLVSMVLTALTELFVYIKFDKYIHQIAPLMVIIPMILMGSAMLKFQFMKEDVKDPEYLYMEKFRTKIMQLVSIAYFLSGFLYATTMVQFKTTGVTNKNMLFVFVFWILAYLVWIIQKKVTTYRVKTLAYSFVLSLSVPIITLKYMDNGAITAWAFPMLIIIAALLFRNTVIIIMVAYSTLLTQYYMWIFYPNQTATINVFDYIGRTWILALGILLVCYINNIYLIRLKQLYDKIKVQEFLFLLLSDANKLDSENCDRNIPDILNSLSNYLNVDSICLTYGIKEEEQAYYAWKENAKASTEKLMKGEWWKIQGSVSGFVKIDDCSKLPSFAKMEKGILIKQGIKSLLAVPIIGKGEKVGWLKVNSIRSYRNWEEDEIKILSSVANILGDAKRRIHHEIKMEQMTFYDQLTCIPNRQMFGQCIDRKIITTEIRNERFSILFLDLDSFKNINDTMGHQYGDKILIAVSDKLSTCLRRTDVIGRFGGDEFLIMLNDITEQSDIESAVDKILKIFETPFLIQDKEFKITASVGISVYPMDGLDKETLIKNADIAMYKAKERGKNQFAFCTQEMKTETSQAAIITNELIKAMDNQEFNLVYQPQVEVKTGKVIAAESLIRWDSRVLGSVSPAVFIPIAEQNGLIIQIGEWVLWEACRQLKSLEIMGIPLIRFAVNISVKQLQCEDFIRKVSEIIEETGINPANLELEITESVAIQDTEMIKEKLLDLKQLGVLIAIDDFGMEYSSLSRINSLPIDRLKLDMFFVKGILTSEKDRVILDAIIKMAKSLDMRVIAEGVEEEEQYRFLKERFCDEIQGYLFYRPMNAVMLESVLIEQDNV